MRIVTKHRNIVTSVLLAAALCVVSIVSTAAPNFGGETLSVDAIVENTNCVAYYQGRDGRAEVLIVIKDDKGNERMRQATILRKDTEANTCGEQKTYVYFHRPADISKTSFLVWKHIDKADDRWLYLPALDLVKRIADSDKRTSFVGSHFFYEDVTGRGITEDSHVLVEVTDKHYVLKNVPNDPSSVEFTHFNMWIDRSNFVPMKVEYHDRSGAKYRVYEALSVENIQGYPTVTRARISDTHMKGETTITFSNVRYNVGLENSIYTERYLRNPPRKYFQ